jgi:hypothetical protein
MNRYSEMDRDVAVPVGGGVRCRAESTYLLDSVHLFFRHEVGNRLGAAVSFVISRLFAGTAYAQDAQADDHDMRSRNR